mgnify:CR=1 FL=1
MATACSSSTGATASGKRSANLVLEKQLRPQTGGADLHYLFAPLKRARLDYMVQKATEMGVARLQPVLTRYTVAERVNGERMRANVIEAAEQCGILRVPEVAAPERLEKVLASWDAGRRLIFCDEGAPTADPIAALRGIGPGPLALRSYRASSLNPRRISLAVSASAPRSRAAIAMACEAWAGL